MTDPLPSEEATLFPKTAGEKLREARETLGLSLAEIAARTRVPVRQLEAIELGNYAALPSITYSVGFAKAYARAVGLDEVSVAREVRGASDQPNAVRRTEYEAYEIDEPSRVPTRGLAVGTLIVAVLLLIAYALAERLKEGKTLLLETASAINDMLNPRFVERLEQLAEKIQDNENLFIIGKSWNYPMALESAIKIQEVSYVHAEGFAGGELKHGPIALIEEGSPCIVLTGNDEALQDILSNAQELRARGAHIIGVGPRKFEVFHEWIKVPEAGNAQALLNIIPIQVLAYFLAVKRGKNPDMPRNLAKSVTVK